MVLCALVFSCTAFVLCQKSIVDTVTVQLVCSFIGIAVGVFLFAKRRGGMTLKNVALFVIIALLTAEAACTLFLGANMMLPTDGTATEAKAVVSRKYSETRHRSKRVGRKYITSGEEYKVYYIEVAFPDGSKKKRPVDFGRYRKTSAGDTVSFFVKRGFFDIPYISGEAR